MTTLVKSKSLNFSSLALIWLMMSLCLNLWPWTSIRLWMPTDNHTKLYYSIHSSLLDSCFIFVLSPPSFNTFIPSLIFTEKIGTLEEDCHRQPLMTSTFETFSVCTYILSHPGCGHRRVPVPLSEPPGLIFSHLLKDIPPESLFDIIGFSFIGLLGHCHQHWNMATLNHAKNKSWTSLPLLPLPFPCSKSR